MASFHSYLKSPEGNDRKQLYESSHLILYTFYALISYTRKFVLFLLVMTVCVCVSFVRPMALIRRNFMKLSYQ